MSTKTKTSTTKTTKPAVKEEPEVQKPEPVKVARELKKDTRLISIDDFDWSRIVYSEPQKSEIPDGSGHYRRVHLKYMYDDETIGPVIVEFGRKYCYGVQPDNTDKDGKVIKDKSTGKEKALRGYNVPLVMTSVNKNNPNALPEEQKEVDFIEAMRQEVIRYAIENKKLIGKGAKTDSQIEGMVGQLLYRKKDKDGNLEPDSAPKLYGKLIYYTNKKEVGTVFYGPGDRQMDPLSVKDHCYVYPTIRFESIFVGGTAISMTHHVYDATVEPINRAPAKRLARKNTVEAGSEVLPEPSHETLASGEVEGDVNDMMESEEE